MDPSSKNNHKYDLQGNKNIDKPADEFVGLTLDDNDNDTEINFNDDISISEQNHNNKTFLGNKVENFAKRYRRKKENIKNIVRLAVTPLLLLWNSMNENSNITENNQLNRLENLMDARNNGENNSILSSHFLRLTNHLLRMNKHTREESVKAIRSAVEKYARLVVNGTNVPLNGIDNSVETTRVTDDIDFVKNKETGKCSDSDDGDEAEEDMDDTEDQMSSKAPTEVIGILLLEIFGSVVGLSWGIINQIQDFYMQNFKS